MGPVIVHSEPCTAVLGLLAEVPQAAAHMQKVHTLAACHSMGPEAATKMQHAAMDACERHSLLADLPPDCLQGSECYLGHEAGLDGPAKPEQQRAAPMQQVSALRVHEVLSQGHCWG